MGRTMVTAITGRAPYVSICGPLASGKTTITKLLAARFGWSLLLEDLGANPYFQDYYGDMPRWGFHTVTAFMVRALTLQDEIATRLTHKGICQDWHFAEHYEIYGIHVFEQGIISERDLRIFEELHRYLIGHSANPDFVIVLTAEPTTLLARVTKRKRPSEQEIPLTYVEHLVTRYTEWARTLSTPYITVNTTDDDVIRDSAAADRITARVQHAMLTT